MGKVVGVRIAKNGVVHGLKPVTGYTYCGKPVDPIIALTQKTQSRVTCKKCLKKLEEV